MATYYKNKNQVKLKPVETLGYTAGKGYYADGQPACTGVIIDRSQILTAGHCVMSGGDDGGSATPLPASDFAVEAGVSDYKEPLKSGHPQFRSVFAVRAMPGYIASSRRTLRNYLDAVAHDLRSADAVATAGSRPRRCACCVSPERAYTYASRCTQFVTAGFGAERPLYHVNGTLNEVVKSAVRRGCSTKQVLCSFQPTSTCYGDSGSGTVESGPHPTVVGILSEQENHNCRPGLDYYVFVASPGALRFIRTSMKTSHLHGISDGSVSTVTGFSPSAAIFSPH